MRLKIFTFSLITRIKTFGTYLGTAKGMNGDVTVEVTVISDKIESVNLTSHNETIGISDPTIEQISTFIVGKNLAEVDIVACATLTSNAIIQAVTQALDKAAGKEVAEETVSSAKPLAFTDPDVIVVGAGFSGMNAALEAAENGAKVMLIDKNSEMGGSIRYAGGTLSAAGAKMQIDAGVEDSEENFIADIDKMGGGMNIPELTVKHVSKAAEAVDWIDSLGANFGDRQPKQPATYDAFAIAREYRVEGKGKEMVELVRPLLEKKVEEGTVEILLETEVKDIIIEEGAVTGVQLTDGTEYKSKSVVLATGGYGHNEEMLNEYNYKNVLTNSPEFVTGDGYKFALKAGAKLNNMDYLPAVDSNAERQMNEFENLDSEKISRRSSSI